MRSQSFFLLCVILFTFRSFALAEISDSQSSDEGSTLQVAADSSLRSVIKELSQGWADSHQDALINLELTNEGTIRKEWEHGHPFDLIIVADPAINQNVSSDFPAPQPLAGNELVVFGPKPLIPDEKSEWYDLIQEEWESYALGDPELVASGRAAGEALRTHQIKANPKIHTYLTHDSSEALDKVLQNESEAAFLLRTDLQGVTLQGYTLFTVDPHDYPPITYVALNVTKNKKKKLLIQSLIDYLKTTQADIIWKKFGFAAITH